MANERIKMITMQIKNGVCLLCIFALMLLLAACFSPHTTQAEVRSFSVILLLVIGLLLMSVLALIAFLRYSHVRKPIQPYSLSTVQVARFTISVFAVLLLS
jgi:uncharacterized membrane protein